MQRLISFYILCLIGCSCPTEETVGSNSDALTDKDDAVLVQRAAHVIDVQINSCVPDEFIADEIPPGYVIDPNCPPVIIDPPRLILRGDIGPVVKRQCCD